MQHLRLVTTAVDTTSPTGRDAQQWQAFWLVMTPEQRARYLHLVSCAVRGARHQSCAQRTPDPPDSDAGA